MNKTVDCSSPTSYRAIELERRWNIGVGTHSNNSRGPAATPQSLFFSGSLVASGPPSWASSGRVGESNGDEEQSRAMPTPIPTCAGELWCTDMELIAHELHREREGDWIKGKNGCRMTNSPSLGPRGRRGCRADACVALSCSGRTIDCMCVHDAKPSRDKRQTLTHAFLTCASSNRQSMPVMSLVPTLVLLLCANEIRPSV